MLLFWIWCHGGEGEPDGLSSDWIFPTFWWFEKFKGACGSRHKPIWGSIFDITKQRSSKNRKFDGTILEWKKMKKKSIEPCFNDLWIFFYANLHIIVLRSYVKSIKSRRDSQLDHKGDSNIKHIGWRRYGY